VLLSESNALVPPGQKLMIRTIESLVTKSNLTLNINFSPYSDFDRVSLCGMTSIHVSKHQNM
jgi:hypothetical protein